MSSALSGPNGRGMSRSETMVLSPTLTSKQPLRGFSALIVTLPPAALTAASIFAARVLNAPHDLHADGDRAGCRRPWRASWRWS